MTSHKHERRQIQKLQQQAEQAWSRELVQHMELTPSTPPALSLMGLGEAATYLKQHPEYLNASLTHPNWAIRTAAVQVLGKQGKAVEPLLKALHDENASVRAAATRALGIQGKQAPVEPLVEMLQDPEWRVRTAAATALGRLKNRTPVEPLLPALHDEHESVRAAAVWALGTLGEQAPIEHLVIALQDKAWAVREAAVMSLQEQGERAPFGHLLAARWDEDSSVREAAEDASKFHVDEQEGQKIIPAATSWLSSSWLRLALAVLSVFSLVSLTSLSTNSEYIGRFALLSQLAATLAICTAIALINILYQRKPASKTASPKHLQQQGSATPLQNVLLAGISVFTLTQVAYSLLMQNGFVYNPVITASTVHFIFISRLVVLGMMIATVIVINIVFFRKH